MPALTRTFDPKVGPLIQVVISLPGQMRSLAGQTGRESLELNSYDFLVDTGADTTCISKEIIDLLGLSPQGRIRMITPNGLYEANTYLVDISIAFGDMVFNLEGQQAIEYNGSTSNYKGLIGRDIICRGVLSISFDNRYVFAL